MIDVVVGIVVASAFISWSVSPKGFKRDSTDPVRGRSGLTVYTDAATGVQYVGAPFVGLTLRVDGQGQPFTDQGN